jgi:uncharacterized lipoprotein YmbA
MRRIGVVLLLLVMSAGMLGCASPAEPPRNVYSDPDAARARSSERTQELERGIQK